ncbi:nucleotidyltransferase domain-containing protein [Streptomyces sp. PvR006]|uniref:nucleotidyltransferase domain-containing protein n=1 Tax=Streptomyces sp. PvR006 TaxID=2817860 RepID=UPI001AE7E695
MIRNVRIPSWLSSLLREAIFDFLGSTHCVEIFFFGSITRTAADQNGDVDILVIYEEGALKLAHAFCSHLRSLTTHPPLDVIALSRQEERETSFVAIVGAKRFWPPP